MRVSEKDVKIKEKQGAAAWFSIIWRVRWLDR
jgi:hypothetical protein